MAFLCLLDPGGAALRFFKKYWFSWKVPEVPVPKLNVCAEVCTADPLCEGFSFGMRVAPSPGSCGRGFQDNRDSPRALDCPEPPSALG